MSPRRRPSGPRARSCRISNARPRCALATGQTRSFHTRLVIVPKCGPLGLLAAPTIFLPLSGARLPIARVVILHAVATPLNRGRALRARPRSVQTVFLERGARLAPLRVRTDHVGHDNYATLRQSRVSRGLSADLRRSCDSRMLLVQAD